MPPSWRSAAARRELRRFLALALPSAARSLLELVPWLVSLAVVGRLGTRELAALSLVETWAYSPMVIVWQAVAVTQGTLMSQAHGARSVGAMRGWGALSFASALALSVLVAALWALTPNVLRAAGFDAELVALGFREYVLFAMPALLFTTLNVVAAVYLASMQAPGIPTVIALVECVVDLPVTYLLVFGVPAAGFPGLGLRGSALGWVIGSAISSALYVPALRWATSGGRELAYGGGEEDADAAAEDDAEEDDAEEARPAGAAHAATTEEGAASAPPRTEALQDTGYVAASATAAGADGADADAAADAGADTRGLRAFVRSRRRWRAFGEQLLPNAASAVLTMCQYQAVSFLAASLGNVDIAAHNAAIALFEVVHVLAVGSAEATAVRVGFHLGRGDAPAARRAAIVAVAAAAAASIAVAGAGYACRAYMGRIISDDPAVVGMIEGLADAFWSSFVLLSVGIVASGVLEGQGRATAQLVPAVVGGWLVGVGLAVCSWRLTGLGLRGLWLAMLVGNVVFCALTAVFVARSDWRKCAEEASARAEAEEGELRQANGELRQALLADTPQ